MKKFEFTGEEKFFWGRTVKRIRAIRDFGDVKAGELGGWIESEKNLSHDDLCWVSEDAVVRGNARVYGNAQVRENAVIMENARVYGNARVDENAVVCGDARVRGNAEVTENAEVYGVVEVYGNATVSGNAKIGGNARVGGNALIGTLEDIFAASHMGRGYRFGTLTAYRTKDGGVGVTQSSFNGTLDEFTEDVNDKHGNSKIGKEYRILIEFLQVRFSVEDVA